MNQIERIAAYIILALIVLALAACLLAIAREQVRKHHSSASESHVSRDEMRDLTYASDDALSRRRRDVSKDWDWPTSPCSAFDCEARGGPHACMCSFADRVDDSDGNPV